MIERVLIVGLGLMGGSLGMALKRLGRGVRVAGHDADPAVPERALAREAIDDVEPAGFPNVALYDAIFVAVPMSAIPPLLTDLAARARPGAILTDMGSTKSGLHRALAGQLPAHVHYIGGHPMTGSEIEGIAGADPHLFENAVWILTGAEDAPQASLTELLEGIGALVTPMDAEQHDRIVAMTSHLPYLSAVALVNALQTRFPTPSEALALAAGGFLDSTRIASGPPAVYRDIVLANQANIQEGIDLLIAELTRMRASVARGDGPALAGRFADARRLRASLPRFRKGFPVPFFELVVQAQDRPGFLGEVATLLGERRINIKDFVLMHVREGEPGTILLAFRTEGDLTAALESLSGAGFVAHRR
jgi:prephenate dehydrogenase